MGLQSQTSLHTSCTAPLESDQVTRSTAIIRFCISPVAQFNKNSPRPTFHGRFDTNSWDGRPTVTLAPTADAIAALYTCALVGGARLPHVFLPHDLLTPFSPLQNLKVTSIDASVGKTAGPKRSCCGRRRGWNLLGRAGQPSVVVLTDSCQIRKSSLCSLVDKQISKFYRPLMLCYACVGVLCECGLQVVSKWLQKLQQRAI